MFAMLISEKAGKLDKAGGEKCGDSEKLKFTAKTLASEDSANPSGESFKTLTQRTPRW
jgi:hypothetical protein